MSVIAPASPVRRAAAVRAASCGWSEQTLCSLFEISDCIRLVIRAMASHAYPDQDQQAVRLALDESLTNAIRHGNGGNSGKRVFLRSRVLRDQVWIEVEDEGDGFNPNDIPDPRQPENLDRPSGRGLLLMRSFMNLVVHSKSGRLVRMCKRRGGMLAGFLNGQAATAS